MRLSSAVLLYPGCILYEVAAACELLSEYGEVSYFTPEGLLHSGSNSMKIQPTGSYVDLSTSAWSCVLVPGGNPDSIIPSGIATDTLRSADKNESVIASICAGTLVIASAGLLAGRTITHNYTQEHAPKEIVDKANLLWREANYVRRDCVVDGRFITAQPWASTLFAAETAVALGIFDETEKKNYIVKSTFTYGGNA